MTTIGQYVQRRELDHLRARLAKLEQMEMTRGIISLQRAAVEKAERDGVSVGGDQSLLGLEFSGVEICRGRLGRQYVRFTTESGPVHFYPAARYGRFISRGQD